MVLYIKDRHLRSYDLDSGKDAPIMSLRKPSTSWTPGEPPRVPACVYIVCC